MNRPGAHARPLAARSASHRRRLEVLTIALTVWAARGFAAGSAGNLQLWQLVLLGVVLVVVPVPLVWVGAVRTRWWLRYRSATGRFPDPWKG